MQLREYQKLGVEFLKNRKYALLADDIGVGKTVQAISALNGAKNPVLVICPASVKLHWQNQFKIWRKIEAFVIGPKDGGVMPNASVLIVNYDLISQNNKRIFNHLKGLKFSTIICDEAHRLKNPKAKRTKRVLSKFGLIANTEKMWFLTGTPIHNRPIDLYTLLASCAPHLIKPYDDYMGFAFRYCGAFQGKFGLNVRGSSRESELNEKIKPFFLRRRKEDVLHELPDKIVTKIEFECSAHAKELIAQEEQKTLEESGESDPAYFKLGEIVRLRKAVAKYKTPEAIKFIKDTMEEAGKVVVFFHHHEVAAELAKALADQGVVVVSGQDNIHHKAAKIKKFVEDPDTKIFLGQMQACGEGVDGLQQAANVCIFVEPSWSPSDIDQAIGRLHRMGQKDSVVAYILTIEDTIESKMMDTILWKQKVIKKILDEPGTKTEKYPPDGGEEKKESGMYLEQRVEKLEKIVADCVNTIDKLTQLAAGPKAEVAQESATRGPGRPPKAKVAAAEINVEDVRELANQIMQNDPTNGKTTCVNIIKAHGSGKKLAECDQNELRAIKKELDDVLKEIQEAGPALDEI